MGEVADDGPRFGPRSHDENDRSGWEGIFEATVEIEGRRFREAFAEVTSNARGKGVEEKIGTEDSNNQQTQEFTNIGWRWK